MPEYVVGHEFVREPQALLKTGDVVETHTHNYWHNTHLTLGLWEVHRYQPIIKAGGSQATDGDGELLWTELPLLKIQGGGPRSIVPIPSNMKHKFVVLEGPAFYRCCFVHRDAAGNPAEVYHGYDQAYL